MATIVPRTDGTTRFASPGRSDGYTLFRENHNQTGKRNAAKNLSTLRRIALNALKQATDHSKSKRPSSLTKKQLRAAKDENYLEELPSRA